MRAQRIFDDGFQGVGDGLRFGRMAEEREGLSQQPLLKKRDGQRIWTPYRTPISSKMLWRWNYFTLGLKRFAYIVGQAQKRVFLVDDQR
ncbi:hypothetical protein [Rhizobium rhizoryzae]|uniref:Uncharacterized protein n=1 Tax=Rhizobium rhizoryzae TaxID=451876 RepID=A0A7W6PU98_9HYPH|nr:hypothetical protein [Rhizobium rhizoryzae]MBB4145992.1 hypothetical protein [Rhizobium rhizoryzae]